MIPFSKAETLQVLYGLVLLKDEKAYQVGFIFQNLALFGYH